MSLIMKIYHMNLLFSDSHSPPLHILCEIKGCIILSTARQLDSSTVLDSSRQLDRMHTCCLSRLLRHGSTEARQRSTVVDRQRSDRGPTGRQLSIDRGSTEIDSSTVRALDWRRCSSEDATNSAVHAYLDSTCVHQQACTMTYSRVRQSQHCQDER